MRCKIIFILFVIGLFSLNQFVRYFLGLPADWISVVVSFLAGFLFSSLIPDTPIIKSDSK